MCSRRLWVPRRSPFVLLLDEVDLLVTRKQNVLYKLLDWSVERQQHHKERRAFLS